MAISRFMRAPRKASAMASSSPTRLRSPSSSTASLRLAASAARGGGARPRRPRSRPGTRRWRLPARSARGCSPRRSARRRPRRASRGLARGGAGSRAFLIKFAEGRTRNPLGNLRKVVTPTPATLRASPPPGPVRVRFPRIWMATYKAAPWRDFWPPARVSLSLDFDAS